MLTIIIEALLGFFLVLVLMQLFKKRPTAPQPDLANLSAADARVGDVISISGAGDNMSDLDFTIDRSQLVQAGAHRWSELSGPYHEHRVILRVTNGEDLETAIHTDTRKLSIEDLGLSEDDLAEMDERQNTADTFEFDGKVWVYRLSRDAHASGANQPPTGFYYWEFHEQNGKGLLVIRKLEGDPFTVTPFTEIPPGDITVYRGAAA